MCGILVIYCKYEEKDIDQCLNSKKMLSNRGPDQSQIITEPHVVCFTRLAIVDDKNEKAMQPFLDGNIIAVCNGEIYNHKELINEYGLECYSESDCECILHLYKKIGSKLFSMLRGDFASVIIDGDNMYFGRDVVGVRPLFMGRTNSGNLALASYARALVDFCSEVTQLKPGYGHYNVTSNQVTFTEYDTNLITEPLHVIDGVNNPSFEATALIKEKLTTAVKDRLMSDRPIGCLLSGGLDSSLIVSILCKLIGAQNVRTYSVGMKGSKDLEYAKMLADNLGTHHTEVIFEPDEALAVIPEVIRDLESYDITTIRASIGMWLLAKWISKNTSDIVLFSGEGADELFCGYLYFHCAPNSLELKNESIRLVRNLYLYDVLRADRCISSHGLELRVPFLDYNMIKLCTNMSGELLKPIDGIEKHILRKSFSEGYLPDSILWRRKEAFSDGVSGTDKKWYQHIQDYVSLIITDDVYDKSKFPSQEAQYYRMIYDRLFPTYQPVYDYWLPKWTEHGGNPSATVLKIYETNF